MLVEAWKPTQSIFYSFDKGQFGSKENKRGKSHHISTKPILIDKILSLHPDKGLSLI